MSNKQSNDNEHASYTDDEDYLNNEEPQTSVDAIRGESRGEDDANVEEEQQEGESGEVETQKRRQTRRPTNNQPGAQTSSNTRRRSLSPQRFAPRYPQQYHNNYAKRPFFYRNMEMGGDYPMRDDYMMPRHMQHQFSYRGNRDGQFMRHDRPNYSSFPRVNREFEPEVDEVDEGFVPPDAHNERRPRFSRPNYRGGNFQPRSPPFFARGGGHYGQYRGRGGRGRGGDRFAYPYQSRGNYRPREEDGPWMEPQRQSNVDEQPSKPEAKKPLPKKNLKKEE